MLIQEVKFSIQHNIKIISPQIVPWVPNLVNIRTLLCTYR